MIPKDIIDEYNQKQVDENIMALLDKAAVTFQIVMTKIDKPKQYELTQSIEKTREALQKHPAAFPAILLNGPLSPFSVVDFLT